jgi:dihydrofolate synthase/folylpolyglutamate synthase
LNFSDAVAALDARIPTRMVPDLDRMRAVSDLLNQPQRNYPSIHITGTNGKTTTAGVAAELLKAAGLRVGTYTSPHLHNVRERIAYDGAPISEEEFAETLAYLQPFLEQVDALGERVTYFETLTILAQAWFAERAVDVAVMEVGMGGEWDATNLVNGRVAIITEVTVDHPELGKTPVEVAREKAGIIKEGAICVTAERDGDVLAVIEDRCRAVGAEMRVVGKDFALERRELAVGGQSLDVRLGDQAHADVFAPVFGERMATDVLLALAAVTAFLGDRRLEDEIVRGAVAAVRSPGRLEVLRRHPLVIADGAHNPAAARELASAVRESFASDRRFVVIGMLADKDIAGVVGEIVPIADEVVVTSPRSPRAAPAERVAEEVRHAGIDPETVATVEGAVALALELAGDDDLVLVTGSFTTVAEARAVVLGLA